MSFSLNKNEKQFLLQLARKSIYSYLKNEKRAIEDYYSKNLETPSGAFVTLHLKGALRGCIGYVKPHKPLQDAIVDLAISAAFSDPRFPALSEQEYPDVELEISVLTPLEQIFGLAEIDIGRDGLLIKNGFNEGLLLPQVATEYNWDAQTFMEQTCHKAGLASDAWQQDETDIFSFSAIIFDESQFTAKGT